MQFMEEIAVFLMVQAKHCSVCEKTKPLTEFHRDRKGTFGVRKWCKECAISYAKCYYQANKPLPPKRKRARRKVRTA